MAEPMDEDSGSSVGEYTPGSYPADSLPEASSRLDSETADLIDDVRMAFTISYDRLPNSVRWRFRQFEEDLDYANFHSNLKAAVCDHALDEFTMGNAYFYATVTKLFGAELPWLQDLRPSSYLRTDFEGEIQASARMAVATTQGKKTSPKTKPSHKAPPNPSKTKSFPEDKEVTELDSTDSSDDSSDGEGIEILEIPEIEVPSKELTIRKSKEAYNQNWLRDWLQEKGFATVDDLKLHSYKGWQIEAPKIQLIRAKNFLSDEDADRTVGWQNKLAELAEYFAFLLTDYKGEDWGFDLKEAINMLHTHWVFETYHYQRPKLALEFPDLWPQLRKRLPTQPGPEIKLRPHKPKPLAPRILLYTHANQPFQDMQYEMDRKLMSQKYLKEYIGDDEDFDPTGKNTKCRDGRGFNMFEVEIASFDQCMRHGADFTAEFLLGDGNFSFEKNRDLVPPSYEATPESLRSFSKFRGGRRAAFQQCLNLFDNFENRVASNSWNSVVLPTLSPAECDKAGLVFEPIYMDAVPEKAARDPFKYTIGHSWFVELDQFWARWTRDHAVKEAYGHKLYEKREEPIMDVPSNFKGPWRLESLDTEMKKTFEMLKRFKVIHQKLKRTAQRAPRSSMDELLAYVESGFQAKGHLEASPWLSPSELDNDEPILLRPLEEEWLRFLGEESSNQMLRTSNSEATQDPLSQLFARRLQSMLADPSPDALFNDCEPKEFGAFIHELNLGGNARLKLYQFSEDGAIEVAEGCAEAGIIKISHDPFDSRPMISRPGFDLHPEDRIRMREQKDYLTVRRIRKEAAAEENPVEKEEEEDTASVSTISTVVSVPGVEEDKTGFEMYLPQWENLFSYDDCVKHIEGDIDEPRTAEEHKTEAMDIFRRLAYRLGWSITTLEARHQIDIATLTPKQISRNENFQKFVNECWHKDSEDRPNKAKKNPAKAPGDNTRVTPEYRDIVQMVEPEAYQEKWGVYDSWNQFEHETADIVRKAILREAYENKSTLFPTRTCRIVDSDDATREVGRREAVWAFGDVSVRGVTRQAWNIDRWPLHLQSEEMLRQIRASGPERLREDEKTTAAGHTESLDSSRKSKVVSRPSRSRLLRKAHGRQKRHLMHPEPTKGDITYGELALNRRRFVPGQNLFWGADTPLKKKLIERKIRAVIGGGQKRRGFFARLFGRRPRPEIEPGALPHVNPLLIPKSQPQECKRSEDESRPAVREPTSKSPAVNYKKDDPRSPQDEGIVETKVSTRGGQLWRSLELELEALGGEEMVLEEEEFTEFDFISPF